MGMHLRSKDDPTKVVCGRRYFTPEDRSIVDTVQATTCKTCLRIAWRWACKDTLHLHLVTA